MFALNLILVLCNKKLYFKDYPWIADDFLRIKNCFFHHNQFEIKMQFIWPNYILFQNGSKNSFFVDHAETNFYSKQFGISLEPFNSWYNFKRLFKKNECVKLILELNKQMERIDHITIVLLLWIFLMDIFFLHKTQQ